jgi:serine/threonine protein phosphatase PrpC
VKATAAARSDVGQVREGNEDAYLVEEPLFGVADGMGGHVAGDVASQTAVSVITEKASGTASPDVLPELLKEANTAIWEKAQSDPSLHGMGTTCTLLLLDNEQAFFAHVGDSRAYLLRDDELSQVTEDHTLVQRMVKEGRLNREDANAHPQRSIITRALGVDPQVQVDTFEIRVRDGDRLLLCSDGLTSMVSDSRIQEILTGESDPQRAGDRLIALANEAGGEDNITVVIVDIGDGSRSATSPAVQGEPQRQTTDPSGPEAASPAQASDDLAARPRRWLRVLVAIVLSVAIVVAGGFIAVRYFVMDRSYFVGVNDAGLVTIYRGIPQDIAGVDLKEEEEITTLALTEIPEFLRNDVEEGITAESLDDAHSRVDDLERRAADKEFEDTKRKRRK